jgi:intein/homing endonuclease
MDAHNRKTIATILAHPAPRQLKWEKFLHVFDDVADSVENESGDRLAVEMNGHRTVFHRPHNGVVSIEDIERARHLLLATPDLKGAGTALVVTVDTETARLIDFDLDTEKVSETEQDVHNPDRRARRMRTVEKRTGNDDEQVLVTFFEDIAAALKSDGDRTFVVLGHGAGKSDVAAELVARLKAHHPDVAAHLAGVGEIDLSAANDDAIERKTVELLHAAQ